MRLPHLLSTLRRAARPLFTVKSVAWCTTIYALLFLGAQNVFAQEPPVGMVNPEPIAMTGWQALVSPSGVAILLQNLTTRQVSVTLEVGRLQPIAGGEGAVELQVEPDSVTLGPAETALVRLRGQGPAPPPGTYVGQLLLQAEGASLLRTISLEVPSGAPEEWSVRAVRGLRLRAGRSPLRMEVVALHPPGLPLSANELLQPGRAEPAAQLVHQGKDELAPVYLLDPQPVSAVQMLNSQETSAEFWAPLLLPRQMRVGAYETNLTLPGGDSVHLTVLVTDGLWLPLVVLIFGAAVTFGSKRWTGLGRQLNHLRQRVAETRKVWAHIDDKLHPYSAQQDVEAKLQELDALLAQPKWWFMLAVDEADPDLQRVNGVLALLQETRPIVDRFGNALHELDELIGTAWSDPPPGPATAALQKPALVEEAQKLRVGCPLQVEKLHQVYAQMQDVIRLGQAWPKLQDGLKNDQAWIDALTGQVSEMPSGDRGRLQLAQRLVSEAEWELWTAPNLSAFVARDTRKDINKAERLLSQLNHYLKTGWKQPFWAVFSRSFVEGEPVLVLDERSLSWSAFLPRLLAQEPEAQARALRIRRVFWDLAVVLLYGALAVYGGLQQLYWSQDAFGTLQDYMEVFLWGLGAKVTLDAVYTGLVRLMRSRW